ncbi:MAG: hypothetical protein ABJC26_16065, partial [Gemmatimonadaceae bacterium]
IEQKRTTLATITKGVALNRLGMSAILDGKWDRGDSLFKQALAMLAAIVPPSNLERLDVQLKRETMAEHFARWAQADSIIQENLQTVLATLGIDSREHAMFLAQQAGLFAATGKLPLARSASAAAVRIIDSIPEVASVVRATIYQSRAIITSGDRDWATSDTLLRKAQQALRDVKRGFPIVTVAANYGFVLVKQNRLVEADSQLTHALAAYTASGITMIALKNYLHALRAYAYDRANNPAGVTSEIGQLPTAMQASVRAFVVQQRALDAGPVSKAAH